MALLKEDGSSDIELINKLLTRNKDESTDLEKETEQIWNRFRKDQSEIDRNRDIVNFFVYLKDDELMSDFPKDCLDVLTKSITFIRSALENGNYDRSKERLYRLTVEEGLRIVNTSTFF